MSSRSLPGADICQEGRTTIVPNPAISFGDGADISDAYVPDAILDDISPRVADSKILRALKRYGSRPHTGVSFTCRFAATGPVFVRARDGPRFKGSYEYYAHDPRVELVDADSTTRGGSVGSGSVGSGGWGPRGSIAGKEAPSVASYPPVPKTFLNEDSCQPAPMQPLGELPGARGRSGRNLAARRNFKPREASDERLILDPETIRKFYDLDGRYAYVMKGLPTADLESPCGGGWHRWVRYGPDSDRDGCPGGDTTLPSEISTALIRQIASELNKRDDMTRLSIRALDVWGVKCDDAGGSAVAGARLYVGGSGGCWTNANPSEYGVFDASWWVLEHPGNSPKHLKFQTNPIAAVAEESGSGRIRSSSSQVSAEDRVTLTFPSWHSPNNFNVYVWNSVSMGLYGDAVDFSDLPWETRGPGMARFVGGTTISGEDDREGAAFELCGSPGEVANDPGMGHRYNLFTSADRGVVSRSELDQEHYTHDSKSTVWASVVLGAPDQLRQRIAWALSQIFVVSSVSLNFQSMTEPWVAYYDIFVNNAFGMFGDIIKQVSFSPMMGRYLTYISSKSFAHSFENDGKGYFPDENYAREVLQLFSIGLTMLHENGTEILDDDGNPVPTYTNKDIETFARGWTGFEGQKSRPNLEASRLMGNHPNLIDPMKISSREGRDVLPKLGLDFHDGEDRRYIGDGVQRCDSMPRRAYLSRGAKYRYLGSSRQPTLSKLDAAWQARDPNAPTLVLSPDTSSLYASLCDPDPSVSNGPCRFRSTVALTENLVCDGLCVATESGGDGDFGCECGVDSPRVVRLDPSPRTGGSRVYFEYVRPP